MKKNLILKTIILLIIINFENLFSQPLAFGKEKFLGNVFGFSGVPLSFDNYWNQITPENNTKWGVVEGSRDNYSWARVDEIYNYAKQRGYPFKFHTLVWGQQYPNWITSLSLEEQREEVEEWIRLVGERYPDIDMIDVVNEPLTGHAPAPYREALGGAGKTGWDWIIQAFEWARKYIPKAKLILNEYNVINDSYNTTQILNIVNLLKERNLIDGIGIQGHRFELENASINVLKSNLDRLAATGLPIYISEFDLGNISDSGTPDDNKQLELYKKIFPVLWEHPGVKGITFWGYIEGQIWQKTAFLIRSDGTERPAMQWLRQYLTSKNTFKSFQNGNWEDLTTWQEFDGTQWVNPASKIPDASSDVITIQNNHTITLNTIDSVDQLIVYDNGKLIINKNASLKIKNGIGVDATIRGTIENFGNIIKDDSATINFYDGSKYYHKRDGGNVPYALWSTNSIAQFDSLTNQMFNNFNQSFGNVIWNCTRQQSDLSIRLGEMLIKGYLYVMSTGNANLILVSDETKNSISVNLQGNYIQSGGNVMICNTTSQIKNIIIEHNGSFSISSGKFIINDGGNTEVLWKLNGGDFTIRNATITNRNINKNKFLFNNINNAQSLTLENVNYEFAGLSLEVESGVTLNSGNTELKGNGKFTLKDDAVLRIAHKDGIDGFLGTTNQINISRNSGIVFNGTQVQYTGVLMPDSIKYIAVDNSSGLSLSKNILINDVFEIKRGSLITGNYKLSYGNNSTLKYSGSSGQYTSDAEFPVENGPTNLLISNPSTAGVILHADRKISGRLELQGKLKLEEANLEVSEAISGGASKYVITNSTGELRILVGNSEILFPVGVASSYAPVWIENKGTPDLIGVRVQEDKTPAAYGGRVQAKWYINENEPGGGNYSLKFGWIITLEDAIFKQDRNANAFIFNLSDTTEAGTGSYEKEFSRQPYTIKRSGIDKLGVFAVGKFDLSSDLVENNIKAEEFYLSQNYPNPFNPVTTIKFSIPSGNNYRTSLKVYDILGNEIETLIDEIKSPGTYELKFNAKNYPSGVYFYKLQYGNHVQVKKMTLIK